MNQNHLFVVIMAGGGGTRLWPHSLRRRPKQYLPLLPGGETLLGATVRRVRPICEIGRILVITTADQVAEVRRCVPDLPIDNILVEPIGRNTAPCIGLAALTVRRRDPDAVMAVLPSDHHVQDEAAFARALTEAAAAAAHGHVVAIGARPTRPETGYGYLHLGTADASGGARDPGAGDLHRVAAFVEKPDLARAEAYVQSGDYLWNIGTFFFPAVRILAELHRNLPALGAILDELTSHPERTAARYPEAPAISIDYAVMERLGEQAVGPERAIRAVTADFGWNDIGSFSALADLHPGDAQGNHVVDNPAGPAPVLVAARRNLIWNSTGQLVAAAHVDDLIIAVTEGAVLILPRSRAQDVREIVDQIRKDEEPAGRTRYL